MRLERLSSDQFKIFLTFDDLIERGLTKEDLWHDLPQMQALFHDMMYEASDELGFELEGVLLVQVHVMQAQGMLIIVTQSHLDDDDDEDFVEMKVTLDESKELIFLFESFEDLIQLAIHLEQIGIKGGAIYHFEGNYYMHLLDEDVLEINREHIIALISEFSSPSILTSHRLIEYGKTIMPNNAVQKLNKHFTN
ncbi:adapter protein MecA 2 [Paraliobacillus quinghaiensis]|uniref:Adapter protein MecA n=1 Tax=Paraliobacillus quinghaiensis TaxID=470815 RepID=A0A917TH60_9BACI|nr:genetic competence negative regulator [Paraliobacillus quinghaiensis]GGM22715.1 adapter protein MecA 2 [Paraliobacillus quinghaiensis]